MATKIVTKNSSTASAVPTASDLVQGELAVNVADKRLFTEDNAGAIVELGTNPSTLTVTGEITANGGIALGDNDKATFGLSDDLQIFHDGSDSYVKDVGAGNLYIDSSDTIIRANGTENSAKFIGNGRVELYYDAEKKFETTSTGIDVTGNVTMATGGSIVAGGANDLILNAGESGTPDIYLQSGSSTKVKIEGSNGNVGIAGQTNPTYKLDGGFADQTWGWYLNSSYNAGFTYNTTERSLLISTKSAENIDHIKFATGGAATERMRIDSSGNLLVGGTSAFGADTITLGTGGFAGIRNTAGSCLELRRDSTDGSIIDFQKDGTAVGNIGTNVGRLSIGSGDTGVLFAGDIDAIYPANGIAARDSAIDLGVSGARFKDLYLSGAITAGGGISASPLVMSLATNNSNCDVTMQSANSSSVTRLRNGTNDFQVHTNGLERMRITSAGSLMVNSTTNYGKFVVENGGNSYPVWFRNTSSAIDYPNRIMSNYATGGQTATMLQFLNGGSAAVGAIKSTASATSYVTSSDQRLKENIADADDAGSKIDAIQVRQYDWKVDGSHQDYGMVAQELQAVAPEAVSGDADSEEMMGVDYSKLVPMLVKEIQSLRNRVAQLEE